MSYITQDIHFIEASYTYIDYIYIDRFYIYISVEVSPYLLCTQLSRKICEGHKRRFYRPIMGRGFLEVENKGLSSLKGKEGELQ